MGRRYAAFELGRSLRMLPAHKFDKFINEIVYTKKAVLMGQLLFCVKLS